MSAGSVKTMVQNVQNRRKNVHDEEQSGQPSVMNDDLVHSVNQKICERRFHNFKNFMWISTNFTHCSLQDYHSYDILSQVLCKMGSENSNIYCVNSVLSYVQVIICIT
jgi:hypothetical protein